MLHFRKVYEVVGYTYEADIHCPACAVKRFGEAQLRDAMPVDREGNMVYPLFLGDTNGDEHCGTCGEQLDV